MDARGFRRSIEVMLLWSKLVHTMVMEVKSSESLAHIALFQPFLLYLSPPCCSLFFYTPLCIFVLLWTTISYPFAQHLIADDCTDVLLYWVLKGGSEVVCERESFIHGTTGGVIKNQSTAHHECVNLHVSGNASLSHPSLHCPLLCPPYAYNKISVLP